MKDRRLFAKIIARTTTADNGCWLWTGPAWNKRKSPGNRYGYISLWDSATKKSRATGAHRAMWIAMYGQPAEGLCVMHACDNPLCVNPDHLLLGTHKANMSDCRAKDRYYYAAQTHCKRGHPFTPENTEVRGDRGQHRQCKTCQRARHRIEAGWPEDLAYTLPIGSKNPRTSFQQKASPADVGP